MLGTQESESGSVVDRSEEQTSVAGDPREGSRLSSDRSEEQTSVAGDPGEGSRLSS